MSKASSNPPGFETKPLDIKLRLMASKIIQLMGFPQGMSSPEGLQTYIQFHQFKWSHLKLYSMEFINDEEN